MPAVNLSPVAGAGWQFFDNNGNPLSGGKLFTYAAGTTTNQATYTSSSGNTAHTNPIILNAAGRVPGSSEVWLAVGLAYKFIAKTSTDVQLWSADNITSISGTALIQNFTGTGSQINFTLSSPPFGENATSVYINGVYQQKNTYSITGVVLTFSEAPPVTSSIEVMYN